MTTSTDGQICFGVPFDEDTELPWSTAPFDGDLEDWWVYGVRGFKHSTEIYDRSGEYLGGIKPSDAAISAYHQEYRTFLEEHPIPVGVINYCSGDYPMWMLVAPGTVLTASRGFPEAIYPARLAEDDGYRKALIEFCETHNIEIDEQQLRWWLSSYWG